MTEEFPVPVGDQLYWVPGENGARFPYCHAYLWVDVEKIIAFDPQCGQKQLRKALSRLGRDVRDITAIVCTHFHIDHSASNVPLKEKSGAEIWAHELDVPALRSLDKFVERYGIEDPTMRAKWQEFLVTFGVKAHEVDHVFKDGDVVPGDFQVIHTPGHSPGHCCFYKAGTLIAGDIDCTTPWVGNASSSVGDFLASIERLQSMDIQTLLPGHGVPIQENVQDALEAFRQKIIRREGHLLEILSGEPITLEQIIQQVDQMKQEKATGDVLPERSPFAAHFAQVSTGNYLLHLQSLGQIEVVVDENQELWRLS